MKRIIKTISVLLAAVAIVTALALGASAATATVKLDNVNGKRGETVTVNVTLSGAENANTLGISLNYDKNVLELVSGEWLLSGALLSDFNKTNEEGALAYAAAQNLNGKVFKITFKVKSGAAIGKSSVSCNLIVKNNSTVISTSVTAGSVNVSCNHSMTATAEKKATCTTGGNKAYYFCSKCNKYFSDKSGTKETTVSASSISALGHDIKKILAKPATCGSAGNKEYFKCTRCNECYGDSKGNNKISESSVTIPKNDTAHSLIEVAAKDATCSTVGVKAHYKCSVCSKLFGDSQGKTEVSTASVEIAKLAHTPTEKATSQYLSKEGSCTTSATYYKSCSVCGEKLSETFVDGSAFGHKYVYTKKDYEKHIGKCSACGDESESSHNWSKETVILAPSEEKDGLSLCACDECGYEKLTVSKLVKEEITVEVTVPIEVTVPVEVTVTVPVEVEVPVEIPVESPASFAGWIVAAAVAVISTATIVIILMCKKKRK